jgi:hypothetical protein
MNFNKGINLIFANSHQCGLNFYIPKKDKRGASPPYQR